ncbi:hypothetical protein MMC08_000611 [Hypocenomyce scalaris]|nr:hypothetical protein [Hypocenomyce scalaris]
MPLFLSGPSSPFEAPSLLYEFFASPLNFLVRYAYAFILFLRGPAYQPPPTPIRIVCLSDTHTQTPSSVPSGDILIHAGDLANTGTASEIQAQIDWLASLPHREKIVIAGNHDSYFDPSSRAACDSGRTLEWAKIHYLQYSSITLAFPEHSNRRLNIYGAPGIPRCGGDDFAFQYQRHEDEWTDTIPRNTDILVTHTPPRHHLDLPAGTGCDYLLKEVWRVRPKVHVFGHVHAGYGGENVFWDEGQAAYERLCAREGAGVIRDMVSVSAWTDALRVLGYGLVGILWTRLWGGGGDGGVMVNASLAYRSTGKLGNAPQIVDI